MRGWGGLDRHLDAIFLMAGTRPPSPPPGGWLAFAKTVVCEEEGGGGGLEIVKSFGHDCKALSLSMQWVFLFITSSSPCFLIYYIFVSLFSAAAITQQTIREARSSSIYPPNSSIQCMYLLFCFLIFWWFKERNQKTHFYFYFLHARWLDWWGGEGLGMYIRINVCSLTIA